MNMFTLARYSGEYIPIKFEETSIINPSLKKYVHNNVEAENVQFPDNIFWYHNENSLKKTSNQQKLRCVL